jgi:hypothetical protein
MDKLNNVSDENGQEIGGNVYDEDENELIEGEEAAIAPQPVGVVREEIVTVTKDNDSEDDDIHEVVKAHSDQISRLTNIVESLQSPFVSFHHGEGWSNCANLLSCSKTMASIGWQMWTPLPLHNTVGLPPKVWSMFLLVSSTAPQNSLAVVNKHRSMSMKIKFGACLFIPLNPV